MQRLPGVDLISKVVWVGGAGFKSTYALLGDKGPAFGEGSIAMHQLLRDGAVTTQPVGPIPVDQRCSAAETDLRKPFVSRPGAGSKDRCRAGHVATSASDIRAYSGIDAMLDFVVLGAARFDRKGGVIASEITVPAIRARADEAGYTEEKIAAMLACLDK